MKNLIVLFFSLFIIGSLFQACDNTKTYAEMLDEERNAVDLFIKDQKITVISKDEFEKDAITDLSKNEYVSFSNGVYMQIVNRGVEQKTDTFATNDEICVRYVEQNISTRDTATFNVFLPEFADAPQYYMMPAVFRYVVDATTSYGTFLEMNYLWAKAYNSTVVPSGWLLALPYLRNEAHVKLIVPSKMGHNTAQQYVTPYFYDIRSFEKAKN